MLSLSIQEDEDDICDEYEIDSPASISVGHASAFSALMKHGGIQSGPRRASVAVWSDPRLVQLAQNNVAPNSRERKPRSCTLPSEFRFSTEDIAAVVPDKQEPGYGILGKMITSKILGFLDFPTLYRLRRTCNGFKDLISDEAATYPGLRFIDMSSHHKKMNDTILEGMADFCGSAIDTLSLKGCWIVTNRAYEIIGTKMPNMRNLCMASVWESTDAGFTYFSKLPSTFRDPIMLTTLDLSNCKKITDAGILILLDACTSITHLELSYCKNLTERMFEHEGWRRFKRLNLQRCTAVRDNAFVIWNTQSKVFA
jgi:F-box/leucine-rich repeat protein 7